MLISQGPGRFQRWEFDTMLLSMSPRAWYTQRAPRIFRIMSFKRSREDPWRHILFIGPLLIGSPIKAWRSAAIKAWSDTRQRHTPGGVQMQQRLVWLPTTIGASLNSFPCESSTSNLLDTRVRYTVMEPYCDTIWPYI